MESLFEIKIVTSHRLSFRTHDVPVTSFPVIKLYLPAQKRLPKAYYQRNRKPLFTAIELLPVSHSILLHLNRCRGLAGAVIEHAVYALNFVDDSVCDF